MKNLRSLNPVCYAMLMGSNAEAAAGVQQFRLSLRGAFGLDGPDGERVAVTSKRGQALLALLGTASKGERSRNWLETILWCDRQSDQAKSSLRKELSNLKKLTTHCGKPLLHADHSRIWLDRDRVWIDVFDDENPMFQEQFLEGLDIAGEEAFEDWLRDQREALSNASPPPQLTAVPSAPASVASRPKLTLAIAVLPFRIEPPEPDMEYAANGLGEELINRLSRLRWLPVIAHSSSFALGTDPIDLRTAGLALGARYIVEATLRPLGERYRLNISLSDVELSRSLWSEGLTLDKIDDLAAINASLDGITATLGHRIDQTEQIRAIRKSDDTSDMLQLIWKARWHIALLNDDGMTAAKSYLDRAEKLQPEASEFLIEKANWMTRQTWLQRGSVEQIRAMRKAAQKAIHADPDDARGYMLAGTAEFWLHQPMRAEDLLRRAVELNPSLVTARAQLGCLLHHEGELEQSIEELNIAIRLSPNDCDLFYTEGELAMAYLAKGELHLAVRHAEASLARRAAYWSSHVARINALIGLNMKPEAKLAYGELMEMQPDFKPEFIDWLPYQDRQRNEALKEGLNQAASLAD